MTYKKVFDTNYWMVRQNNIKY